MGILTWIIVGGLAGWIASLIMKKDKSLGLLGNIIVGIIGSFIGGAIVSVITGNDIGMTFSISSLIVAIIGAVILLAIINLIRKGSVK